MLDKNKIIKRKLSNKIIEFIDNNNQLSDKNILWVYGVGGVGKTQLAKWINYNKKDKIIFYINFEELDNINNISFEDFINVFVTKDKLSFFSKFMNIWIDIENDERIKKNLSEGVNAIKSFFEKFKFQWINYLESEEAKNITSIVVNFLSYIMNNKKNKFEKIFWEFLKEHRNEFVVIIDTFEYQLNTKIKSNLLFFNNTLSIVSNEKEYLLKKYLTSLINYSQIKTIIFSRYHPQILLNNLLGDMNFLRENFNKVNILELNKLSFEELSEFLELESVNLNKNEKRDILELIKNNFAVLKLLIDSFKSNSNKKTSFKNFLNAIGIGKHKVSNNHFLVQFLLFDIIKYNLKNSDEENLIRLALYGGLDDRIQKRLTLDYNKYLHILNYNYKYNNYHIHSIIKDSIIFMAFNKAVNSKDFSIIYNIAEEIVDLCKEDNSENCLLNKLAVSKIELKKIEFKKEFFIFFKEDVLLFYNENFPYLNFYTFFKIIRLYPFMTYDDKEKFIDMLCQQQIESDEIKYWLDLFGSFYSKGIKVWNDLKDNTFKDLENYIEYLQFVFLAGYKKYSKILKNYEEQFKEKESFEFFKKIIEKNKEELKKSIKKILKSNKINLDDKYKIIGLFMFYDRKTRENNFSRIMNELKNDKNFKENPILKLSELLQTIKKNINSKNIKNEIKSFLDSYKNEESAIIYFLKATNYVLYQNMDNALNEFKKGLEIDFSIFSFINYIFKDKNSKQQIISKINYRFIKKYSIMSILEYIKILKEHNEETAIKVAKYFSKETLSSEIINKYLNLLSKKNLDNAIKEAEEFINKIDSYSVNVILKYIELLNIKDEETAIEVAKYFSKETLSSEIINKYLNLLSKKNLDNAIKEAEEFINKIDSYSVNVILKYIELLNIKDEETAIEVAKYFSKETYQKDIIIRYVKLLKENKNINKTIEVIKYFFNKTNDFDILFQYVSLLKELLKDEVQVNELDENLLNQMKKITNSNYLNDLAVVFRKLGDFQSAIECCKKAIKVSNNKNIFAMVNCGFSYKSLGDKFKELGKDIKEIEEQYKNAEKCFKEAITIKEEVAAYYGLGQLYYNWYFINNKKQNLESAKQYIKKALSFNKKNNKDKIKYLIFLSKALSLLKEDYTNTIEEANYLLKVLKKKSNEKIEKWVEDEISNLLIKAINEKLHNM